MVSLATSSVQTSRYSVQTTCYSVLGDSVHLVLCSVLLQHGIRRASISSHLNYSKAHAHSHEICERGPQSLLFRLVTWSVSGFRVRMAISTVSEHDVQTNHKIATANETTISLVLRNLNMENLIDRI